MKNAINKGKNGTVIPDLKGFIMYWGRQMGKQLNIVESRNLKKGPSFVLCLVTWLILLSNLQDSSEV